MEIVSFLAAHHGNRSPLAPVSEAGAQRLVGGVLYFQPIYCSVEKGAYRCSSSQMGLWRDSVIQQANPF